MVGMGKNVLYDRNVFPVGPFGIFDSCPVITAQHQGIGLSASGEHVLGEIKVVLDCIKFNKYSILYIIFFKVSVIFSFYGYNFKILMRLLCMDKLKEGSV